MALDAVGHLDMNPNTFAWWRSELSREATPSRLTLLPVATPLLPREPAPVDVVLPSGIVVRVPLGGDLFESADRESNRFPTGCSSVAWTRKTGDVIDY